MAERWFGASGAAPAGRPLRSSPSSRLRKSSSRRLPRRRELKRTWFQRLKVGLSRSSTQHRPRHDRHFHQAQARRGPRSTISRTSSSRPTSASAPRHGSARRSGAGATSKGISPDEVKPSSRRRSSGRSTPVARPLMIDASKKPVRDSRRRRQRLRQDDDDRQARSQIQRPRARRLCSPPGDTFRAAAIEQLRVWARRTASDLVERDQGADAAGLAFDALDPRPRARCRCRADGHCRPAAEPRRADEPSSRRSSA